MSSELDPPLNDGSKPLQFIANDWFYMKSGDGEVCDTNSYNNALCDANKCAVSSLQVSTDNLGAAEMQYNDAKMLYNRELLFSINMFAGLVLICYYIYVNQSAIPSPAGALKTMGEASSWTSRLAMSPATAVAPKT
jgi:hypothetical protein